MEKIQRRKISIGIDNVNNTTYIEFIKKRFDIENIISFKSLLEEDVKVDLLVFTGGADVNPSYYNDKKGKYTHVNNKRDEIEFNIGSHYRYAFTPKLGICRGAQLLTVVNKGKLIQHVTGHSLSHEISVSLPYVSNIKPEYYDEGLVDEIDNSLTLSMTSTHHQMMYPYNLKDNDYELIAWSTYFLSEVYLNGNNEEYNIKSGFLEPEIVYYKKYKSLCIQGHPEYGTCDKKTVELCLDLIDFKLLKKDD